ncbi:MAG: Ig-like domain-containing protein [Bacilli bacterium]|nr:Ig-like domain-containing protein [Bacilli bacterium]
MKRKLVVPFAVLAMFMGLTACNTQGDKKSADVNPTSSKSEQAEIKLTFSVANKTLTKGEKGTVTSSVDGVKWSIDNKDVATIDDKGEVTAVGAGKAVITASKEGYPDATITITVVLKKIVISAEGNKKTLVIGESVKLTADVANVTWSTGDAKIAAVDTTGKVTAVGAGTVTITAEAEGFTKGSISIEVTRPAANLTFDLTTDAEHYSADGWWEVASTGGFSMESSTGWNPTMSAMSWGGDSEVDPYIGGFGVGDKETIKFNSTKANEAEFLLNIGNADAMVLSNVMSVKLNGTALNLAGLELEEHPGQFGNSMTFDDLSLGKATLKNGENTLVFEFLDAAAPRLNTLSIFAGDAKITLIAPAAKEQITVENAKLEVIEGETVQIATSVQGVSYESVNADVATVTSTGLVTGVTVGITDITVKKEGMYSVRVRITVNPKPVAGQIIVEAENAAELQGEEVPQGIMVNTDGNGGMFGGGNVVHSGGKYVSAWGVSDLTLSYTFNATENKTMSFSIVGSAPMSMGGDAADFVFADSAVITVNGQTFSTSASFAAPQGFSMTMEEVVLGDVAVKNGENTFSIAFSGSVPSLDCFKFSTK